MFQNLKNCWQLALKTAQQWDALEVSLRRLVRGLIQAADPGNVVLSGDFSFWTYPAAYGHKSSYDTSEFPQKALANARDMFLPLIAPGTLALSCLERRRRIDPQYQWRERLLQKTSLHPKWISSFERSDAASKHILRVEGILDAHLLVNRQRVCALVALYHTLNVPICIYWGSFDSVPMTFLRAILSDKQRLWMDRVDTSWVIQHDEEVHFAKLVLSTHEMELLSCNKVQISDMIKASFRDEPVPVASDKDFKLVENDSGQLPQETWQQFFLRRDQRHAKQQETPEKCQKGSTVWYWEQQGNLCVRTLTIRREHPDIWRQYAPNQVRFNSWANCWDICTEFGDNPDNDIDFDEAVPHSEPQVNVSEGDKGPLFASEGYGPQDVGNQEEAEAEEGEVEEGELEEGDFNVSAAGKKQSADAFGLLRGENALKLEYSLEDLAIALDTVAYKHYGFTGDPVNLGLASERLDWARTCKLLGDRKWLDNLDNARFKPIDLPKS
ncbi:hypothetical protein PM082_015492 [Marasmius tenuissimus]|nr:hypothetical protein PM082_015492 [Marasmius tenuissimus]